MEQILQFFISNITTIIQVLTLITVIISIINYKLTNNLLILLIGINLFFAGMMDAFHTLATDQFFHTLCSKKFNFRRSAISCVTAAAYGSAVKSRSDKLSLNVTSCDPK